MTRKPRNAGVVVVLTMLLCMAPLLRSGTVLAADGVSPAAQCATLHRVEAPEPGAHSLDLHVEALNGIIIAEGADKRSPRLLLLNSRVPATIAGPLSLDHHLLQSLELVESTWGHEAEARINLSVGPNVSIAAEPGEGVTHVRISRDGEHFTINFIETPYPVVEVPLAAGGGALKAKLLELASTSGSSDAPSWWDGASQDGMKTMLRAVRDADIRMRAYESALAAAQEDGAAEAPSGGEEAPAIEEAQPAPVEEVEVPAPPAPREPRVTSSTEANRELVKTQLAASAPDLEGDAPVVVTRSVWRGDPLQQPVTIDFREMQLVNAVQILSSMAGINVVAGADLIGTVSLNLKDVPLKQAIETALRLNGLGMVEEQGIYHIKPYLEAVASNRTTDVVDIENAEASEIATTLKEMLGGSEFESLISISANKTANTVIVTGPEEQIGPLLRMARRLDVEQAVLPTVTLPVKLNYADPQDMMAVIQPILTKEVGGVTVDQRARILVVTDIPIIVEKIADLVKQLDIPAKSVAIEGMIVDVTLTDGADTGVNWLISAVQNQSRRDAAGNTGIFTGNLQELSFGSALDVGATAGLLNFGVLSGDIDWRGIIQAEVRNNNSTLLSNPKLITVENQPATITIASQIPYVELTQTDQGGQQTSTAFKDIGTELSVTPTVTHDNHIIAKVQAKESTTSGQLNNIPIEDKREISTTPHIASGETIYVGGLRKNNDTINVRKVPVLGNVPVMNFLFRSNQRSETVNELLIFLTCTVLDDGPLPLTQYQQGRVDQVRDARLEVSAETAVIYDTVYPGEMRDPAWKWRKHRSDTDPVGSGE